MLKNGKISQVMGAVVDVAFEDGHLPDIYNALKVDRGDKREYCAGSIAKSFEEIDGKVVYFGKPYPPVYEIAADVNNKKILCIGDNLNTDIKGANIQNFDSLLITGGIHREEMSKLSIKNVLKNDEAKIDYFQKELKW